MADLDSTLRRVLDDRAASVAPGGGVPPEVARRAHRRRLGQQTGLGVMAAIALAAVVVQVQPTERAANVVSVPRPTVVPTLPGPSPTTLATAVGPTTTTPAAGPQAATTTTIRPPANPPPDSRVPFAIALPAGAPRTFAALTTDGRLAVVETATGQPTRMVSEPREGKDISELSLTADRRYAYYTHSSQEPCFGELGLSQLDDGPIRLPSFPPASPTGFAQHRPLPRPGSGDLAFGRSTCRPIGERTNEVVIGRTGSTWSEQTYAGFVPLAWSPDGDHLYAQEEASWSVVVLDVNPAGEVTGQRPVPLDDTCHRASFVVSPSSGHVVADMACTAGEYRRDLLEIDPATGATVRRVVPVTSRGLWGGLSYDASGKHLLYTDAGGVYLLDGNKPIRVAPADWYADVAW